jgi:hypothetical protein
VLCTHTFTVESEEARVLNFYAPAGAEMQMIFLAHPAEERRRPTMAESAPPKKSEPNEIIRTVQVKSILLQVNAHSLYHPNKGEPR